MEQLWDSIMEFLAPYAFDLGLRPDTLFFIIVGAVLVVSAITGAIRQSGTPTQPPDPVSGSARELPPDPSFSDVPAQQPGPDWWQAASGRWYPPEMSASQMPPPPADTDLIEPEKRFDVVLTSAGDKNDKKMRIQIIKEIRALTNLGLKEAVDLYDGAPKPVLEQVSKEDATKAKEALEAAGGAVDLK